MADKAKVNPFAKKGADKAKAGKAPAKAKAKDMKKKC